MGFIPNKYTLFLSKVNSHGFDHKVCWEWLGAGKGNGYGNCTYESKNISSHCLSYLLFVGDIPEGMEACHTCDNRYCVNPDHLFVASRKGNMEDCKNKGRTSGGKRKHLKEHQVQEIRRRNFCGHSPRKISDQTGISYWVVTAVLSGRAYAKIVE